MSAYHRDFETPKHRPPGQRTPSEDPAHDPGARVARARWLVLAAALLFSTGGAGIKTAAFSAAQVSCFRSGVAAIALAAWLRGRLTWTRPVLLIGVVYGATLTLFVAATKTTTAANAIFLQSTAPLYVLLCAPVLLRERFRRVDLLYVGALAAGMVLCFSGQAGGRSTAPAPGTGNLLAFLSSLTWAATLMALRAVERHGVHRGVGLTAVVVGNAVAAAVAAPWALPLPAAPAVDWATIVSLGLFQIGLAYVCLTAAMQHLPALDVSLLLLVEPVLNPCWTWLARGEQPDAATVAGGAVIVAATGMKAILDGRTARGAAGQA
jgi:drug/metabolite transporter (DMT)-like permease